MLRVSTKWLGTEKLGTEKPELSSVKDRLSAGLKRDSARRFSLLWVERGPLSFEIAQTICQAVSSFLFFDSREACPRLSCFRDRDRRLWVSVFLVRHFDSSRGE